jgi:hypothetical protein
VQAALEFTAKDADGGPATNDVAFGLYDAPVTCAALQANGGYLPTSVHHVVFGEVSSIFGTALQGGNYTIPTSTLDDASLFLRTFFDDGGYSDQDASGGQIHYDGSILNPISASLLTGSFSATLPTSTLTGTFTAPYCDPGP